MDYWGQDRQEEDDSNKGETCWFLRQDIFDRPEFVKVRCYGGEKCCNNGCCTPSGPLWMVLGFFLLALLIICLKCCGQCCKGNSRSPEANVS